MKFWFFLLLLVFFTLIVHLYLKIIKSLKFFTKVMIISYSLNALDNFTISNASA